MITHTEWIDPQGMEEVRAILLAMDPRDMCKAQSGRRSFLLAYLDAVDSVYSKPERGPLGVQARPLECAYSRVRSGRLHCSRWTGPDWAKNEPSYVCAQGMPNVLRPYLMGKWGRDIDIENCHVSLMYQLGRDYHEWEEHGGALVPPLTLHSMKRLYEHRDDFFAEVAHFHNLPSDSTRYDGYRKEAIKRLIVRILYGGKYETWLTEQGLFVGHKSPRVLRLEHEIRALRDALLRSKRFKWLVDEEQQAQRRRGRSREAADRGVFSKVAQHLECEVLLVMRQYLLNKGWEVQSLIFDGLIVCHREDALLNLAEMERHVERETHFTVRILEKPLFLTKPPPERLFA